ncbi:MAG: hypothetical protein IPJ69_07990 [Deltaproteobacteria bacterium]|nr:MAG: hypothetical protein IPJ69_07990 [Deltaproteobacteria bacterium]
MVPVSLCKSLYAPNCNSQVLVRDASVCVTMLPKAIDSSKLPTISLSPSTVMMFDRNSCLGRLKTPSDGLKKYFQFYSIDTLRRRVKEQFLAIAKSEVNNGYFRADNNPYTDDEIDFVISLVCADTQLPPNVIRDTMEKHRSLLESQGREAPPLDYIFRAILEVWDIDLEIYREDLKPIIEKYLPILNSEDPAVGYGSENSPTFYKITLFNEIVSICPKIKTVQDVVRAMKVAESKSGPKYMAPNIVAVCEVINEAINDCDIDDEEVKAVLVERCGMDEEGADYLLSQVENFLESHQKAMKSKPKIPLLELMRKYAASEDPVEQAALNAEMDLLASGGVGNKAGKKN